MRLGRVTVRASCRRRRRSTTFDTPQDWALRAAKLERETEESAQIVAGALGTSAEEWRRDLDVVVTGRDAAQAEADPVLLRYRTDRAIARLAPPLARVLATLAGASDGDGAGASEADLALLCRGVVRTFAATGGREGALLPLTRSAVSSLVEHLLELARVAPGRPSAEGRVAEMEAIGAALAQGA